MFFSQYNINENTTLKKNSCPDLWKFKKTVLWQYNINEKFMSWSLKVFKKNSTSYQQIRNSRTGTLLVLTSTNLLDTWSTLSCADSYLQMQWLPSTLLLIYSVKNRISTHWTFMLIAANSHCIHAVSISTKNNDGNWINKKLQFL